MATGIAFYDIWALVNDKETMSSAFERAFHHPLKRWIVVACWAVTTKHLFLRHFAQKSDPFIFLAGIAQLIKLLKEKENDRNFA